MGENNKENVTVTEDVTNQGDGTMPGMVVPEALETEEVSVTSTKTVGNVHIAAPAMVDLDKSIFGTSTYQMVAGKRNTSLARFEEYKTTKPAVAREIENFVAKFDYTNPTHVQNFARDVMGKKSVQMLTEYVKNNKNSEVYDEIRVMLAEFLDDMKPSPKKKSLWQKLTQWVNEGKEKKELAALEEARVDEIIGVMQKRTEKNLTQIATANRAEIKKFLSEEQRKALQLSMFVIAGEIILKKMEEEYLPALKEAYENDPTSVDKKLALKEGEERTIEFLSRLNNVITTSAITQINIDAALKEKDTNKNTEMFLQSILDNTIPALAQQCMLNMMSKQNSIPNEEAEKIQQLTEHMLVKNAQEVGDLYVASVQQYGRPFVSIETLETVASICKEANERAEEAKKEKMAFMFESHEKLEQINNELMISANELAFKTMTKEELNELQKVADSFKPKV